MERRVVDWPLPHHHPGESYTVEGFGSDSLPRLPNTGAALGETVGWPDWGGVRISMAHAICGLWNARIQRPEELPVSLDNRHQIGWQQVV